MFTIVEGGFHRTVEVGSLVSPKRGCQQRDDQVKGSGMDQSELTDLEPSEVISRQYVHSFRYSENYMRFFNFF